MAIKEADENDELQESEEKENIPEEKPKGRKLGSPIKKKKRVSVINISVCTTEMEICTLGHFSGLKIPWELQN